MARRQTRSMPAPATPMSWVGGVAGAAFVIHVAALRFLSGAAPGAYGFGQIFGTHLAAFLITALIASVTRVGSVGAMIAVYLLSFGSLQLLLALTD
ncbi:MAG: hypothetical protein ACFCVC_21155, partial [Acidimicrobiia bacterium]